MPWKSAFVLPIRKCILTAAADTLRHLQRARDEALEAGFKNAILLRFAATHALSFAFFLDWLRSFELIHSVGPLHLISDTMHACEEAMIRGRLRFLLAHSHWIPRSLIIDDLAKGHLVRAGSDAWDIPVDIRLFRPKARQIPTAETFWSSFKKVEARRSA